MRAKLLLVSSALVLGLAACGDDVEQGAEVEVPPPAVEENVAEPVVVEPETDVAEPVVTPESTDPATAETDIVVPETEPEVAGPTGMEQEATEGGTVTTFGGEAGPTVVAPTGEAGATDPTMDPMATDDEPAAGTAGGSPGGN